VSYLDINEYKGYSVLPEVDIDDVEAIQAGWIARKLQATSRAIDARLRKRYSVPFAAPYPETVKDWTARLVDPLVLKKRGVDATDEQFHSIEVDAAAAREEIRETADATGGLFDLPISDNGDKSAISKGGPLGYSETSPYVWMDEEALIGREEDQAGRGTGDA
jgi:hypothetical protein